VGTSDVATQVGVGSYFVAIGDGMTEGFGDNDPSDDNSADGRNMLGGFTPILADSLSAARGYPVTVVNEGVSGAASSVGVATIQSLLQKHPNAQYFMIMYGHNDFRDNVPSGRGLMPGQAGYAGSFKDRIQQIINAINAAGKTALLAKAPAILPLSGAANAAVQDYNIVMDELAATVTNNIPLAPPDFYSYFAAHTNEYADSVVMNGLGYRSMARIWFQSLNQIP
jgi:lysophospholipase L1-like esterase